MRSTPIPRAAATKRPMEEGGGETSTFPFETWRYRYIEGIGQEVMIEFVDTCMCGDYHMTMDRSEKDALKYTPNAGLTLYEPNGYVEQVGPVHQRRPRAIGKVTISIAICRPRSSIVWNSLPNYRRRRREVQGSGRSG